MRVREANELRARILALAGSGLSAMEIAEQARCARGTVYKVLKEPGPDRRARTTPVAEGPLVTAEVLEEIRRVMEAMPSRAEDAGGEGGGTPGEADPYADLMLEEYEAAAAKGDGASHQAEAVVLRALLRQTLKELAAADADPRYADVRLRLREHVVGIVDALSRARRSTRGGTPVTSVGLVRTLEAMKMLRKMLPGEQAVVMQMGSAEEEWADTR